MVILHQIDFGNGLVDVTPPINQDAIVFQLTFDAIHPSSKLSSINMEWVGETAHKINEYIANGLTGGRGIYEGLPYRITVCTDIVTGIDLILDLTNKTTRFECDKVVCPVLEAGNIDQFNIASQGFSFAYLASAIPQYNNSIGYTGPGQIFFSDFKKTPYCISEIPDYNTVVNLLVQDFILGYQEGVLISKSVNDIIKLAGALASVLPSTGAIVIAIVDVIIDLTELGIFTDLFVKSIQDTINNIVQPKKYKLCMREQDLWKKGCEFLGNNFKSSIYGVGTTDNYGGRYVNATWMPEKNVIPVPTSEQTNGFEEFYNRHPNEADTTHNPNAYGYYDGTFAQFISDMCIKYNAKVVVNNGTVYFEEIHNYNINKPFIVPNAVTLGYTFNLPEPYGTNALDLPPVLEVMFKTDDSELNTLKKYKGTSCEVSVLPAVTGNPKHYIHGNGVVTEMPSALGKRKDYLTEPEKIIEDISNTMIDAIKVIGDLQPLFELALAGPVIGAILTALGLIHPNHKTEALDFIDYSAREHWLLLSADGFSVPKSFIGEDVGDGDWRVAIDSVDNMSARQLMRDFHSKNLATHGAQCKTYENTQFGLCCADFRILLSGNIIQLQDGRKGKFVDLTWNLKSELAEKVSYQIFEDFTKNLVESVSVDGVKVDKL